MIGRRDREGPLMRNNAHSLRKSRILTAIAIGVLIGCIFAFLFPNGFFVSDSVTPNRHLSVAGSKTQVLYSSKIVSFFFLFQVSTCGVSSMIFVDCKFLCSDLLCPLCHCGIVFDLAASTPTTFIFILEKQKQASFIFHVMFS